MRRAACACRAGLVCAACTRHETNSGQRRRAQMQVAHAVRLLRHWHGQQGIYQPTVVRLHVQRWQQRLTEARQALAELTRERDRDV